MEIYLVGGAVRDQLLGLRVKERDYVVVGATSDEMLKLGYQQVGKDFPVFLHPQTKEEYALARVERKVGSGYTGFVFDTSAQVTLEEDLKRRDITINAIALDDNKNLIDPYNGVNDLDKRLIKHVSAAFAEDPVRILRIARFMTRFASLGFTIAPETIKLMKDMVEAGEVEALVAERVWKELERALGEANPEKFFQVLHECGADQVLFGDVNFPIKNLLSASKLTTDTKIRFAALMATLSTVEIKKITDHYRIPSEFKELALLVSQHLNDYKNLKNLSSQQILTILQTTDSFRREERFRNYLLACHACKKIESAEEALVLSELFTYYYNVAKNVNIKDIVSAGLPGKEIAERIAAIRLKAIEDMKQSLR